jgi:anti-anti-sigma regulatory factor
LYRATGNRSGFDQAVVEFSWRFPAMVPQWVDFRDITSGPAEQAVPQSAQPGTPKAVDSPVLWRCPAQLDHAGLEHLRDVLSGNPMPWRLDWSPLQSVTADALPLLSALFSSLCAEPVSVEFCGTQVVADVLRALTPSSDRTVPHDRWVLRLDALRVMQRIDDFELAALDYCVTFEVAPPPWMPATCQFAEWELPTAGQGSDTTVTVPLNTVPLRFDGAMQPDGYLGGSLSGDASEALAALEPVVASGRNVLVSCAGLLRVDFAAAGSILNWVAIQQNAGCAIQFVDVHRLVAAFFNVIGINEHARVTPRTI